MMSEVDNNILEVLADAGVDVTDLTGRLMGNMNLITRFFRRYPDDKSYELLVDSINKGDLENAFRAAHTFKGLCANLSMSKLYKQVSRQVEYFRAGDMEKGAELMVEISAEYEHMIKTIESINWE